ncbi:MAG: nucleoside 2-deoxyribosyltransferase [Candidatus Nomurabacteria bacterium]|nr:nucleoside 2-deoxyribosyltransferase [Candidatus Nomurabacteria bacterium]
MKIYFSGSIRGGRGHQAWYDYIVKQISNYGEVLSEFVADKSLTSYGTSNMTDEEIYNRDVRLIEECDIVIADVTNPSLGVGYEIAYAEKINKKIYCLYLKSDNKKISAMISGNKNCEIYPYTSESEITEIIKNIFDK